MTDKEAIRNCNKMIINEMEHIRKFERDFNCKSVHNYDLEFFKKCKEALERCVAMRVIPPKTDNYSECYRCPRCDSDVIKVEFMTPCGYEPKEKYSWCWHCGGKIDWRDV